MTKKEFEKKLGDVVHDYGNFWAYLSDFVALGKRRGFAEKDMAELVKFVELKKEKGLPQACNELWFAFKNMEETEG